MKVTQPQALLSASEIGAYFSVTGRTILNWESRGIINAAVRVDKIVRYNLDDVRAQLAATTEKSVNKIKTKVPSCSLP